AAVSVSIVHYALGIPQENTRLDGQLVRHITSFLGTRGSEVPPRVLKSNEGAAVIGSFVLGIGFVFDDRTSEATSLARMRELVERDIRNSERVFAYVGGEDLNTDPHQRSRRFIIDFGEMTEAEARRWPDLFAIIEAKVKPARASVQQRDRREEWWRHATRSPVLRAFLYDKGRALAISQVTAHLAFSFIDAGVVVSHTTVAVLIESFSGFAVLQSRVHETWARLLSSSMRTDLRYTPSDCFETFPFPRSDLRAVIPSLESMGDGLYSARARFMADTQQGLTKTYNAIKDPSCDDPRILELRRLHERMDRAVLDAYDWSDIAAPPYCPMTDEDRAAVQRFEDEVIDRLYLLNAERAREEARLGIGGKKAKRPAAAGSDEPPPAEAAAKTKARKKKGTGSGDGDGEQQGSLF
ncbi:MAG TPA: type IIL restriction-modification enzyme MmeI, partial [Polyangiaceae bacterium]